jgi:hypothetical protein
LEAITTQGEVNWSVVECEPFVLSAETVKESIAPLNRNNDMLPFIRGMRRAFLQHIARAVIVV